MLRAAIPVLLTVVLAACGLRRHDQPILLFNGTGTSPNDVAAIERLLTDNHLEYAEIDSLGLNVTDEATMGQHRLLIVPGGNFVRIADALTASATGRMRSAIHDGLNYLGICAGAFIAGDSPGNSLNLTSGVRFPFYEAENRGIRKTAVAITIPTAPSLDIYWEDGPQLSGWGVPVARYPDGTPAVVQGSYGKGWVVLSGIHPEAPADWRRGLHFSTPIEPAHAYALRLILAALNHEALAHF